MEDNKRLAIDVTDIVKSNKIKKMKLKYGVGKWVTYNLDSSLGNIGGWILESKRGVEDACKLIIQKKFTVYIHRELGSAIIGWNIRNEYYCGQLWKQGEKIEDFTSTEEAKVKEFLLKWWIKTKMKKNG